MSGQENIVKVFDRADEIDLREGLVAYDAYNQTMRALAERYAYPLESVTAVFASLSPNNDYIGTLRSTVSVLLGHRAGRAPEEIIVSTYNHCKQRAYEFAGGKDFLATTSGPKIRSFYRNILDPTDPEPVTIDGHMIGCWLGRRITMVQAAYEKFSYEEIAEDFRLVAGRVGILPNQVQGVVWFVWKRIHRVVFNPQINLFRVDNQWGNRMAPEEIRPFGRITQ